MTYPVLKWAGGKRTLIPDIINLFPTDFKDRSYHELFIGGGAVFFKIKPKTGTINDVNSHLMNFYRVVKDNPQELISEASKYSYNKKSYYNLRERFNQPNLSKIENAALLLYLNKTAFNGLYRVNSKGKFNVPFGRYKNPTIVPKKRILTASNILKNIEINNEDFSYILDVAEKGDVCYLDPPYQPISSTAYFTSYSKKGFNFIEQIRLRDLCISLSEKEIFFVLSNSYTEQIEKLYSEVKEFKIITVKAKRAISSKASTRGAIKEILVTNIPKKPIQK